MEPNKKRNRLRIPRSISPNQIVKKQMKIKSILMLLKNHLPLNISWEAKVFKTSKHLVVLQKEQLQFVELKTLLNQ